MEKLQQFVEESIPFSQFGQTVSYIPALENKHPNHFAVCILDEHGKQFTAGHTTEKFTLQSMSKIISFIYVCEELGVENVLQFVDVEPTGDAFNSMIRLEITEVGKPFNPMINAGAITVSSLLPGTDKRQRMNGLCQFIYKMTGETVAIDDEVYLSELETANRNRSIAYYLKSNDFLQGDVEVALDLYIQQCSIEVDVQTLAKIALVISNDGVNPQTKERIFSHEIAKISKALMITCGMYNASGKFATFIGMPSKSGVSGGILSVAYHENLEGLQGFLGIATYGPAINHIGNSVAGIEFLTRLSNEYDLSIF